MKQAEFSRKRLRWAEGVFVLSFLPALFIGMFIFVKGFEVRPEPWHRWVFGVSVSLLGISGLAMLAQKFRKDRYPDLLSGYQGTPFEHSGVQVIPVRAPSTTFPGGPLRVGVFFQNRFDALSRLRVRLRFPSGSLAAELDLEVDPGEAGFVWKDLTLPDGLPAGRTLLKLELAGAQGKGREVRFTEGKIVRTDASKALEVIAVALSVHHVHLADQEDVLPIEIDPDAACTLSTAPPEGRIQIWSPAMTVGEQTRAAWEQAMKLLES